MTDWTPEEDEAFNEVEKHSNLGKQILRDLGQPYHFDTYVSPSQRNQVLEEAALMCETFDKRQMFNDEDIAVADACAAAIRGMKK